MMEIYTVEQNKEKKKMKRVLENSETTLNTPTFKL